MRILLDFERDCPTRVKVHLKVPIRIDLLDGPELTISNAELSIWSGELYAVTFAEGTLNFLIERDAL